ncbi:MAG: type II toxin-antitoxin system VapC family toxin [Caulobacteraceae bacterium]
MTDFVLDASITAAWVFADEEHPVATRAQQLLLGGRASAPCLWRYEVRNLLVMNERRGRIIEADTAAFLGRLAQLRIDIDLAADENGLLVLARRHELTVYDAAYLELAERRGLALATLDEALATAAKSDGVPLITADG